MKHFLLFLVLLVPGALLAQTGQVVETKSDGTYTYYYAKSGALSSVKFLDQDLRMGYAVAYNSKGEESYRSDISYSGGSRTVSFRYHPNGMVKEARFHWQPDGGIQSGGTITSFDTLGQKLGERPEMTPWQMQQMLQAPAQQTTVAPNPVKVDAKPTRTVKPIPDKAPRTPSIEAPKQKTRETLVESPPQTIEEGVIYRSTLFAVNKSRVKVTLVPFDIQGQRLDNDRIYPLELAPGDSVKVDQFVDYGPRADPETRYRFALETPGTKALKRVALQWEKALPGVESSQDLHYLIRIVDRKR